MQAREATTPDAPKGSTASSYVGKVDGTLRADSGRAAASSSQRLGDGLRPLLGCLLRVKDAHGAIHVASFLCAGAPPGLSLASDRVLQTRSRDLGRGRKGSEEKDERGALHRQVQRYFTGIVSVHSSRITVG